MLQYDTFSREASAKSFADALQQQGFIVKHEDSNPHLGFTISYRKVTALPVVLPVHIHTFKKPVTRLDCICHNMIVDSAKAEANRCGWEYLDIAKHELSSGNSARALECLLIAAKMWDASLDIERLTVHRP